MKVPHKLTRDQRKLLEQLRETLPAENEPEEKGIFERSKTTSCSREAYCFGML